MWVSVELVSSGHRKLVVIVVESGHGPRLVVTLEDLGSALRRCDLDLFDRATHTDPTLATSGRFPLPWLSDYLGGRPNDLVDIFFRLHEQAPHTVEVPIVFCVIIEASLCLVIQIACRRIEL